MVLAYNSNNNHVSFLDVETKRKKIVWLIVHYSMDCLFVCVCWCWFGLLPFKITTRKSFIHINNNRQFSMFIWFLKNFSFHFSFFFLSPFLSSRILIIIHSLQLQHTIHIIPTIQYGFSLIFDRDLLVIEAFVLPFVVYLI